MAISKTGKLFLLLGGIIAAILIIVVIAIIVAARAMGRPDVPDDSVLVLDVSIVNQLGYHPVRLTDAATCTSCALCARICPDSVFAVFARPKAI